MSPVIKKRRKKITIPPHYLLLALSLLCVLLMVFSFKTSLFEGPLKAVAGKVVVPFQSGIAQVGGYLSDRSKELGQLKDVLEQNQRLQEQVDSLTIENNQLMQERYELNSLRNLYDLDNTYEDYDKIGAHVIASDATNWFYSFTIDKGEEDGIQVDMNVMAGSGLVGRVSSVGPNYAKVQSIISDTSNVSATVLSKSENMIVSGDLQAMQSEGVIRFGQLSVKNSKAAVGDKVVTSSISDKYLPGVLIGYISSINTSSNNLTQTGTITPAVDFSHLEEVLIVTQLKNLPEE